MLKHCAAQHNTLWGFDFFKVKKVENLTKIDIFPFFVVFNVHFLKEKQKPELIENNKKYQKIGAQISFLIV